jgi:hypothetical protein
MKLPWRQASASTAKRRPGAEPPAETAQKCAGLGRALERVLRAEQSRILDLGPLCGDSVVYLAGRGAKVSVEEFSAPPPAPPRDPKVSDDDAPPLPPLAIEQSDALFDLVLAWEHIDFVPPERLREFGAELRRVLAQGGYLLLFARNKPVDDDKAWRRPGRYRVVADDRLVRERGEGPVRRRWVHPTRDIERALAPLTIQGLHLQRNQVREFLAQKP